MTSISSRERLIVALDFPNQKSALELVDKIQHQVSFFKVGLELFSSGEGIGLIEKLANRNCQIFADFKFLDIPATVHRAVRNLNGLGIRFLTVHAYPGVMQAAVDAAQDFSILAVTVLTSMNDEDLRNTGVSSNVPDTVTNRAVSASESGCAGVIASGQEVQMIRSAVSNEFLIVTPGIRNNQSSGDDQKRTVSVTEAFEFGADYLVVGRPIRDADDPQKAAVQFQSEIAGAAGAMRIDE